MFRSRGRLLHTASIVDKTLLSKKFSMRLQPKKQLLSPHNVLTAPVGVERQGKRYVGRLVAAQGAARGLATDLGGLRRRPLGGPLLEIAPAVVEGCAFLLLEARGPLAGRAPALEGRQGNVDIFHHALLNGCIFIQLFLE